MIAGTCGHRFYVLGFQEGPSQGEALPDVHGRKDTIPRLPRTSSYYARGRRSLWLEL